MNTETKQNIPVTSGKESSATGLSALHPIADLERGIERAFDRLFGRRRSSLTSWADFPVADKFFEDFEVRLPSLDVVDRDNDILVRAEIPGIDKKDIDISLTDNLLTVKGQSSSEKKEEKGDYHRHEISSSSFARAVTLPGAVDSTKANATLKDGILEITLPKLESSKRRNIAVQ
ncbi:MAG: Hsp20/alpha crystallin family protein [Methylophilaceae bacterium]|nr:Hsp20/alpha crystallin family protein [Methylophilaceae bacterium]